MGLLARIAGAATRNMFRADIVPLPPPSLSVSYPPSDRRVVTLRDKLLRFNDEQVAEPVSPIFPSTPPWRERLDLESARMSVSPRSKRSIPLATLLLLLLVGTVTTQSAGAVVGDCTPAANWGTARQDLAPRVLDLVNADRTARGLTPLVTSQSLTNAAVWKSRHMAFYSYMAHDDPAPPVARTTGDRLEACGYPATRSGWGENIAWGYSSPESVMQGWLTSAGHRANIENPSSRAIGIGVASDSIGRLFWTQAFGVSLQSTPGVTTTTPPTTTATVTTTRPPACHVPPRRQRQQ